MLRSLMQVEFGDACLVGSVHAPAPGNEGPERAGLLLLNAGPAPRAGNSDLYVHLADGLAARGMHCFRFDLAGLGDSTGASWRVMPEYWRAAQLGGNDAAASTIAKTICERFRLRGLVVGGLCAGAICALRLGDAATDLVLGLLLLEPNFRASHETGPRAAGDGVPSPSRAATRKSKFARLFQPTDLLYALDSRSRSHRALRPLRPFVREALMRRVGHQFPRDTLVPVVLMWRRLMERQVPSLLVVSEGQLADDYLGRLRAVLPAPPPGVVTLARIPNTNHILTMGAARRLTLASAESWLAARFPGVMSDPRNWAVRLRRDESEGDEHPAKVAAHASDATSHTPPPMS